MKIPIEHFLIFKSKAKDELLLFNKKFTNNNIKQLNLKNNNNLSLILNKITIDNLNDKVSQFLQKEFLGSYELLDKFTRDIYFKMISDEHFQLVYLKFYIIIINAYNFYGIKYDFSYLINLVESKFIMDIYNKDVLLSKIIKDNITDNNLTIHNNLKIIYFMIQQNLFSYELFNHIIQTIINNPSFEEHLITLIKINPDKNILQLINKDLYSFRFKVIIDDIFYTQKNTNNITENTNKHINMITYIIEEYLELLEPQEIITFYQNNLNTHSHKDIIFISLDFFFNHKQHKATDIIHILYSNNILPLQHINKYIKKYIKNNKQKDIIIKQFIKYNINLTL